MEGDAGQILWDTGTTSLTDDLIALLRNRFGSVKQAERYRAELRALRRRLGDSLQFAYQKVRRLMVLAFPSQGGTLWEARDAFLDALGDQSLRVRILEKDPTTLDEASKLACRMEAIAQSPPKDDYDDRGQRRDTFVRSLAEAESPCWPDLDRNIERHETVLREYRKEMSRCRDENDLLHQELRRQQHQGRPRDPSGTPERDLRLDPTRRRLPGSWRAGPFDGRSTEGEDPNRLLRLRSADVLSVVYVSTQSRGRNIDGKTLSTPTSTSTFAVRTIAVY